jgi:hypothetical protein
MLHEEVNNMPIHNWTRVEANLFHDFHQTWVVAIRNALNGGLLPKGYRVLIEQHAPALVPDILARHVMRAQEESMAARGNRITIRHSRGQVVCVIEIVSPGNKNSRHALRVFVEKCIEFLKYGVNLLVVDLFPPSKRDPQGIHKAIWDEIEETPFELPPNQPLTLAAYIAGLPKTACIEPIGFGEIISDMPAFLDERHHVDVPLEATYLATFATYPEDMREELETHELGPKESQN